MNQHLRLLSLATLATAAALLGKSVRAQDAVCDKVNDLLLSNGVIHTMDANDSVVSSLRILGERIVGVGEQQPETTTCTRMIDLKGRTAVPGLIDNHNHIVLLGLRPGHDTRLESATSIAEVLEIVARRAAGIAAGEWLTAIGGFDISQFTPAPAAPRFPTLAELDSFVPDHPVYIQQGFAGPGVTNSLGKRFFESKGISIGDDGAVAGGQTPNAATKALFELTQLQTSADRRRGLEDALAYAVSLGLTTHLDQGGFARTNTDADGAAVMDPYSDYASLLALNEERQLKARVRLNFLHMETDAATPRLQARLDNSFPDFGDGMLGVLGIGEFTAGASPIILQPSESWINGTRRVAQAGWRNENHSLTAGDYKTIIDGWQQIHDELGGDGISKLQWVVAHVPFISEEYARKLHALGGGVSVLGGWRYISGTAQANGPPFRMLKQVGIPMGMSSDGMQISPMNPWLGLYYVVTGKNARGEVINGDQTLSRLDALRLYTADNRWFLQQDDLGVLAPGLLADIVVLDKNYFDASAVSDEDIKTVRSVLTIVDGNVVHGDPAAL